MYQGFQPIVQQIESQPLTNAKSSVTTKLNKLVEKLAAQHQHLIALVFEIDALTHTTSSGSTTPDQMNALISRIEFNDGRQPRFVGSGRDLAAFERYETGFRRTAEPVTSATTVLFELRRVLTMGPPRMLGSPTDYALPNAMLSKGFVKVDFDTPTNANANITGFTANYKLWAICVAMDELRIPAFVERRVVGIAAEDTIVGERLVPFAFLGASNVYAAPAAGAYASITLKTGKAEILSGVDAAGITAAYNWDMCAGQIGGLVGDPRGTGDTAARSVNPGTPTALQAEAATLQPLVYCQPSGRLSKIPTRIRANMVIKFTGSNTSGTVLGLTSVLPQTPENIDQYAKDVAETLGESFDLKIKLQAGGGYKKADARYSAYALKPKRAA